MLRIIALIYLTSFFCFFFFLFAHGFLVCNFVPNKSKMAIKSFPLQLQKKKDEPRKNFQLLIAILLQSFSLVSSSNFSIKLNF